MSDTKTSTEAPMNLYKMATAQFQRAADAIALEPSIRSILTEPKNAITKQYQHLFSMDGVELEFTSDAIDMAAEEALRRKTGARGLRTVIEEALMEVMYIIPSISGVRKCIISPDTIRLHRPPVLLNGAGKAIAFPVEQKTA